MPKFGIFPIALLAASPLAFAQSFEASISGGVSQFSDGKIGDDVISASAALNSKIRLKDGFNLGFRIGLNTYRFLGFELGYAYNRSQLHFDGPPVNEQGMGIHQGFGDVLLYAAPEHSRIRPFAAGGVHFSNFVPPGSSAQNGGGETKFGANYGVGLKARVTQSWFVRFDARQYETGKPFHLPNNGGRLFQNEYSAGVGFAL
jgi:opacity protein-like surface antigen